MGPPPNRPIHLAGALSLALFLAPALVGAQQADPGIDPSHPAFVVGPTGFALGVELSSHGQVDELVSPLRYSGFGFGPGLRWGFSAPSGIRSVTASYGAPRLTSSATREGSHVQEGHRFDARLMVLQRVASMGEGKVSLFLGGAVAGQLAFYRHWYSREDEESWMHAFGLLRPGCGWSAELPRGAQLWQDLTFPLVGVALRPGYEGLTEAPKAVWVGFGEARGVDLALHYLQPMGRRFRLGVTYSFAHLRYPEPQPVTANRQSLSLFATLLGGGGG